MKYLIDRKCGNRVYRVTPEKTQYLDPFLNQWIDSELSADAAELDARQAQMYEKALRIAHHAHQGQKDKGGADYINHPVTVSSFAQGNMVSVIAALLHDVVEDTGITLEDLKNSGFDEQVTACVDAVTRRKGEARRDYLARLSRNPDAIYVKLADLKHNSDLSRIPDASQKDLDRVAQYSLETEYLELILKEVKS